MRLHEICYIAFMAVALNACAAKSTYRAQYQCAPNDAAVVQFDLYDNGTFKIEASAFDEEGNLDAPARYHGGYTEGPNTFDLVFDDATHAQIENLFNHTTEGGFIQNANIYRMNKEPGILYIHGCLLVRNLES